ncbi:hypothetical protein WJX72_006911 [[Myrmecia] bisecta]|uniref:Aminopeptidase P N-terminal domain-containing protein n=1 Tax=[Myrmecia] bisecta TaxID=41462 RepID=A0AAW1PT97_9CHLO
MASNAGVLGRAVHRAWQNAGRRIVAGQPIPETHPELFAEGELLPGVSGNEFADRRRRLSELLSPGSVAVIPAAPVQFMAGAIPYPYRQDADFLYLTGIQQQAVAVIESAASGGVYTLFVPQSEKAQWDGARMNCDAAVDVFGADDAYPMTELARRLHPIVNNASAVLYEASSGGGVVHREVRQLYAAMEAGQVKALRATLHQMRWRKSLTEVNMMRASASASAGAMLRCMQQSRPGVHEQQLAASFEYDCKVAGAQRMAYPLVVAGGVDACTIHYTRNDKRVEDGSVLLMDAGCELHGYASDVTRTWPVTGRFSSAQRDLYEVVLDTHRQCIEACRPGATLRSIHQLSVTLLSQGLAQLRIFGNMSGSHIMSNTYRTAYPHSVGHWLGMDTHDTSSVSHDTPLEPGVVLTVEPGLYIPDEERYGRFAGVGVRIEDDVAVTAGAPEVLSAGVPVAAEDVERVVRP